jgi:chromosome segregation ATPase
MFRLDVYHHSADQPDGLVQLLERLDAIMTTQAALAASLQVATSELANVTGIVTKISGETQMLLDLVAQLETAVTNAGNLTPEVEAARDALHAQIEATRAAVQTVDEKVPDLPV